MPAMCGKDGRVRVGVGIGPTQTAIAGLSNWKRSERANTRDILHFESPLSAAGLPIAGVCAGGVVISYSVSGYFFSAPAAGLNYSNEAFPVGTSVVTDYLFDKTSVIGIKGVTCMVVDSEMGDEVDGVASFSATLRQTSADPSPLVA